jgi:hypothetical protein
VPTSTSKKWAVSKIIAANAPNKHVVMKLFRLRSGGTSHVTVLLMFAHLFPESSRYLASNRSGRAISQQALQEQLKIAILRVVIYAPFAAKVVGADAVFV